jgi:hypothetical protein
MPGLVNAICEVPRKLMMLCLLNVTLKVALPHEPAGTTHNWAGKVLDAQVCLFMAYEQ